MSNLNWKDIESAPTDGTEILGWNPERGIRIYWMQSGIEAERKRKERHDIPPCWTTSEDDCANGEYGWHLEGAAYQPTKWHPLPTPPA